MIAIVDYGLGNIANLLNAVRFLGYEVEITKDVDRLRTADTILLPGVGHFQDAMKQIKANDLLAVLDELQAEKPFIGICLGMQLLFESSEEGNIKGLGYLPGHVRLIKGNVPVPHLGWNNLDAANKTLDTQDVYFIHSYQVETTENIIAVASYGDIPVTAIVQKSNLIGIQFHPEKSGEIGLKILDQALKGGFLND